MTDGSFKDIRDKVNSCVLVEKYRPKKLEDCLLEESIRIKFKEYLDTNEIPMGLLFFGNPGVGKTVCAKILAKAIAGDNYLFINASSDTSIDIVRQRVEPFCTSATLEGGLKVVVCDEFDGSSVNFQQALKQNMEKHHKSTRFIFTSNNPQNIEDAILSRCQQYAFGKIPKKEIANKLIGIMKAEGIAYDVQNLANMINGIGTDIRQLINEIEKLTNVVEGKKTLSKYTSSEERILELISLMKKKDWSGARKYITENELNLDSIIKYLMKPDVIKGLSAKKWPDIAILLGEVARDVKIGVDPEVAFASGLASILQIID